MATFDPRISISSASGITGYLYMVLYEASSPNVPVANSGQLAPPHAASRQLQFTGLNPVIHLFKLFETNGVATTGTLLANGSLDPRYPGVEVRADLHIKAGTTSGFPVGGRKYTDPTSSLAGWDYSLEIKGYGTQDPAEDYSLDGDNNPEMNEAGYETQTGEKWVLHFQPKAITYNPTAGASSGGLFSELLFIDADETLLAADAGKFIAIESATSKITVTLPLLSDTLANRPFFFQSQGGSHKNAVIACSGPDTIDWLGGSKTNLILGQSEQAWIFKWVNPNDSADVRWKVLNPSEGIRKVGEIICLDKTPDAGSEDYLNCLFTEGALLDRDVYPRLYEYMLSLDADLIVTDTLWNTAVDGEFIHKGKWSTGDGATNFRAPLLYSPGFLRGVDGVTRKAGSWADEAIGPHTHNTVKNNSGGGTTDDITGNKSIAKRRDNGQSNAYILSGLNGPPDIGKTDDGGGTETVPETRGVYLLIRY